MIERRNRPLWSGWDVLIEAARELTPGLTDPSVFARTVTDRLGEPQDDATILSLRLG